MFLRKLLNDKEPINNITHRHTYFILHITNKQIEKWPHKSHQDYIQKKKHFNITVTSNVDRQ